LAKDITVADDSRNDRNTLSVPFIFVKHGDPLPVRWMAEHPDHIKVPAVMVPHGTRPPPPWSDAGAGAAAAALKPAPAAESRIPGSFAPPPARRKCLPNGQPWPQDRNGRDWPKDRRGRPTRPLWDYPPGVHAPGEGVAPGASGSVGEAEAISSARAALAGLDPANLRAILGSDHTVTQADAPRTRVPVAPLMDDMPGDRAHAGESLQSTTGGTSTNSRNGSANVSQRPDPDASSHPGKNNFMKVGWGDNNFYPSQWSLIRDIPGEGSVTFVAARRYFKWVNWPERHRR
jgi:hypothetical protein